MLGLVERERRERERRVGLGSARRVPPSCQIDQLEGRLSPYVVARRRGLRRRRWVAADPVVGERDVRDVRRARRPHVTADTVARDGLGRGLGVGPRARVEVGRRSVTRRARLVEVVGRELRGRRVRVVAGRAGHLAVRAEAALEAGALHHALGVAGDPEADRVLDGRLGREHRPVRREGAPGPVCRRVLARRVDRLSCQMTLLADVQLQVRRQRRRVDDARVRGLPARLEGCDVGRARPVAALARDAQRHVGVEVLARLVRGPRVVAGEAVERDRPVEARVAIPVAGAEVPDRSLDVPRERHLGEVLAVRRVPTRRGHQVRARRVARTDHVVDRLDALVVGQVGAHLALEEGVAADERLVAVAVGGADDRAGAIGAELLGSGGRVEPAHRPPHPGLGVARRQVGVALLARPVADVRPRRVRRGLGAR